MEGLLIALVMLIIMAAPGTILCILLFKIFKKHINKPKKDKYFTSENEYWNYQTKQRPTYEEWKKANDKKTKQN